MRYFETVVLALATVILMPQSSHAQGNRVAVTARAGVFLPQENLRYVTEEQTWTRLETGPMLEIAAELQTPVQFASIRGSFQFVSSGLAARTLDGESSCGRDCTRFEYQMDHLTDTNLLAGALDIVARGPRFWAVQPFIFGGVGLKHYRIQDDELEGGFATAFESVDQTHRLLHVGAGAALQVGGLTLEAEIGNSISEFPAPRNEQLGYSLAGSVQHDLAVLIGMRFAVN